MAPVGPTAFAVLLWGAIVAVAVLFGYQAYVLARDAELIGAVSSN